jgi:hypothetical protein
LSDDRFTQDPGSTAFASEEEWRAYERAWQLEHKAILRAYGQTPDGEEPEESDADSDADEDVDDLDVYYGG